MYNILLACDARYYETWGINCIKSIQHYADWLKIHVVIVNPDQEYTKLKNVIYHEDRISFPNEMCKIPYYQAVRFIKCAEIFSNSELVFSIDCDTLCTRPFTKEQLNEICSEVSVQRHQKDKRWMAGLVTYGSNNSFRNDLRKKLLERPLETWPYGWDQDILNELDSIYKYKKLMVGDWMSFGRGSGTFLTLKGDQKSSEGYLDIYRDILKNV